MNQIETVTLSHANIDTQIEIVKSLIAGFYYSPHHKATMVISAGGAVFPAKESVEQIKILLKGENVNVGTN